jgi:glutathione S-transferase
MTELTQDPAFQIYAVCALVLGLNLLVIANNTALARTFADQVVNAEDKVLNAKAEVVDYAGAELVQRYRRMHANALENIPLFLVTGLILCLVGVSPLAAGLLFGIFTVARVSHSICYRYGLQPFRTASFAIGALDQLVILGFIAYGVFM